MGILGLAIIAIIGLFFLAGLYKGFIWNLAALGVSVIALLAAYLLMGTVSKAFVKDKGLYNAMLSYTEGSEAIYDVELVDRDIDSLSNDEIDEVIKRANLPFPLGERVRENIMNEEFKSSGITTLGEYFNESLVLSVINIISFILIYLILRVVLTFVVSWVDYSFKFPCLRILDGPVGGAIGIVRGFVDISVIFMLVPIVLTVLPFDGIADMIENSAIASFLHNSNIFLKLIPGTV
jgi:Colicin V production protein.